MDDNLYDSFLDNINDDLNNQTFQSSNIEKQIHLSVKQRGRRHITFVSGIFFLYQKYSDDKKKDKLKSLSSKISKKLSSSCSLKKEENEYIFKIAGDKRYEVEYFLNELELIDNDVKVIIHGE